MLDRLLIPWVAISFTHKALLGSGTLLFTEPNLTSAFLLECETSPEGSPVLITGW